MRHRVLVGSYLDDKEELSFQTQIVAQRQGVLWKQNFPSGFERASLKVRNGLERYRLFAGGDLVNRLLQAET